MTGLKESAETVVQAILLPEFTLPDDQGLPSQSLGLCLNGDISAAVALELGNPEVLSRFRKRAFRTTRMPMPETAVYPYHLAAPWKGYVWATWDSLILKTIPVPHIGEQST